MSLVLLSLYSANSVTTLKVCAQAVDFYMQDQYANERREIVRLSNQTDEASRKLLMGYIREAYSSSFCNVPSIYYSNHV